MRPALKRLERLLAVLGAKAGRSVWDEAIVERNNCYYKRRTTAVAIHVNVIRTGRFLWLKFWSNVPE